MSQRRGRDTGPPEKERPQRSLNRQGPNHQESVTTTDKAKITAQPRQCAAYAVLTQLARRRQASQRMVPLDCGCVDGWRCRCSRPPGRSSCPGQRDAASAVHDDCHLSVNLGDGGGGRFQTALADRWVDAGRDAALHLLRRGHIPLLELEVLQALRRRGGLDRALAEMLYAATGGEIR